MAILNWVAHAAPRHETSIRLLSVSSSENTRSTIIFCMNSHTISRRMDPSYIQNKCSITSLLTEGGPKTKCDPLKLLEEYVCFVIIFRSTYIDLDIAYNMSRHA